MSPPLCLTPFALTSDGSVLLNLAMFDVPTDLPSLAQLAQEQRSRIFIGLVVSAGERSFARAGLAHAFRDRAAWIVGRRQKRAAVARGRKRHDAPR